MNKEKLSNEFIKVFILEISKQKKLNDTLSNGVLLFTDLWEIIEEVAEKMEMPKPFIEKMKLDETILKEEVLEAILNFVGKFFEFNGELYV